jgi:hypothetical protein
MKVLLIGLVVALIIVLFVYLHDILQRKKVEHLRNTGGVDRATTRDALIAADNIILPTHRDHFTRGEILRHNILNNLNNLVIDAFTEMIADQVRIGYERTINANDLPVNPEAIFIVNRMADFPMFANFNTEEIQHAREEIIERRKEKAIANSENKIEAIREYFDEATAYANDPQNVHDNKVNKDLKRILDKIQSRYDKEEIVQQINSYIGNHPNKEQAQLADLVVQKMLEGHSFQPLNTTEDKILCVTWARSLIPENAGNKDNIQEAIYLALVDCWEHNQFVCMNGRIAKVLGSLAMVDHDPDTLVVDDQNYRNQIYKETVDIVDDEVNSALNSSNPDTVAAGRSYYELDSKPTPEIAKLKERIRSRIDQNISTYDNFSPTEQTNLKNECYVAACI